MPSGEELIVTRIQGWRNLPPNTSEFIQTDWTLDTAVNWTMTPKTSTGYEFLYRERQTRPLDDKQTQLNLGARLTHRFNQTFLGNMRLQRSENQEKGEDPFDHISFFVIARRPVPADLRSEPDLQLHP